MALLPWTEIFLDKVAKCPRMQVRRVKESDRSYRAMMKYDMNGDGMLDERGQTPPLPGHTHTHTRTHAHAYTHRDPPAVHWSLRKWSLMKAAV
jgi:hypothetical protein